MCHAKFLVSQQKTLVHGSTENLGAWARKLSILAYFDTIGGWSTTWPDG